MVFAALALAVIPSLATGQWGIWVPRALNFLVVSCPCALVISIPLSFFGGLGGASKQGILVKGSNYLEALAQAGVVVFDKTGTLTQGRFAVTAVHPEGMEEKELLELAAHAEQFSTPSPNPLWPPGEKRLTRTGPPRWRRWPATASGRQSTDAGCWRAT